MSSHAEHPNERMAGPLSDDQVRRRLARLAGPDRVDDVIDVYRAARPDADPDGLFCAAMTDHVFRRLTDAVEARR